MPIISPLRYSGGKSRLYGQIKQYFPHDKEIMIDIFFGGGSIGLNWLQENPKKLLIANDIDENLMAFWYMVKHDLLYFRMYQNLLKITENETLTKEIFNGLDAKENEGTNSPIYYLIRNKCSFNSIGTYSEQAFKQNFNQSTFDRIEKCHKLLERTWINNINYEQWMNELQKEKWLTRAFVYLDPPYLIKSAKHLYKHGKFNHKKLLNILKNAKIQWVLSINDSEEIRTMYCDFNIYEITAVYTMTNAGGNNNKKVKELVITNFK